MYVLNVTDLNTTNDYGNFSDLSFTNNCTDKKNIDIIIPTPLLTIPCGLSFFCLMSLMVYKLINPLLRKK